MTIYTGLFPSSAFEISSPHVHIIYIISVMRKVQSVTRMAELLCLRDRPWLR